MLSVDFFSTYCTSLWGLPGVHHHRCVQLDADDDGSAAVLCKSTGRSESLSDAIKGSTFIFLVLLFLEISIFFFHLLYVRLVFESWYLYITEALLVFHSLIFRHLVLGLFNNQKP